MRIFGFEISRAKALSSVGAGSGGWWPLVREPFSGAWQRNLEIRQESVLSFHADFACRTLIASDIAKLRVKLVQQDNGIWTETKNPAYSPVLRKPNDFQNRIQFFESWVLSKLQSGNTYVLKQRDGRGVVVKLYVLDPNRVQVLVADDGSVFYRLSSDNIAGLQTDIVVPAREIIHDRFNCQYNHPLVGVSPIVANGLAATQGLNIQTQSALLYKNNAMPGGLLVAPTNIGKDDADRIKSQWEESFGGANRGRVAVVGNGVKFEKIPFSAVEGQLIEQLKWTAEVVCSTYHVPPYKIGVGEMPKFTNVQALNLEYYNQALQRHIEDIEICLDEGLGTGEGLGTEFDTDNLLRMDSVTQMEVLDKAKSIMTPDEQRKKIDLQPTPGGNVVYRQQQDFSLEALAKRDAQADPFSTSSAASAAQADAAAANDNASRAAAAVYLQKKLDELSRTRKANR